MKMRVGNSGSKLSVSESSDKQKDVSISKASQFHHTSRGLVSFTASKNNSGSSQGTYSKGRESGFSKIDTFIIVG